MLNTKLALFHELVFKAVTRVGYSAAAITDSIIALAFPETVRVAEQEGAFTMLRTGVNDAVRTVLKSSPDDRQIDFGQVDPQFRTILKKIGLKNVRYFVESLGAHVPVPELIAEPALLDEARNYMRRKGEECLAEAMRLDELYAAVMASKHDGAPA
jgi:hypothetical protein